MTNEIRQLTDEQIKEIFKKTPKTANLEVHDIEYYHYDLFPDGYIVNMTNGTKYSFQQRKRTEYKHIGRNFNVYNSIVKM